MNGLKIGYLAGLDQDARDRAFVDRRDVLADTAGQLRRLARTSWRRPLPPLASGSTAKPTRPAP